MTRPVLVVAFVVVLASTLLAQSIVESAARPTPMDMALSIPSEQSNAGEMQKSPKAVEPPTAVSEALAAVVMVRSYDSSGRELGLGSGFFLPDGRIATNRHVVAGASLVEVRRSSGGLLVGSFTYADAMSISADLAILPRVGNALGPLKLAAKGVAVGTHVFVVGAPLGLQGTVSDGIVSGIRKGEGQTLLQMTAPISEGSSGGPVVDDDGMVVGMSVGQLRDGQNLNFAIPADELRALMASPADKIPFPPIGVDGERSRTTPQTGAFQGLIPAAERTISVADDNDFRVEFKGCYGTATVREVIVCVCAFQPLKVSRVSKKVGVWRAALSGVGGGSATADAASDVLHTYPFSNGERGVTLTSSRGNTQPLLLLLRFLTRYEADARVVLEIGLGSGGVDRTHLFSPSSVVLIDPALSDPRIRSLFGER